LGPLVVAIGCDGNLSTPHLPSIVVIYKRFKKKSDSKIATISYRKGLRKSKSVISFSRRFDFPMAVLGIMPDNERLRKIVT